MSRIRAFIAILLIAVTVAGNASCASNAKASDLMHGVTPAKVNDVPPDNMFIGSMANFSLELFKKSVKERESSLISPLSVALALSMAANGAGGTTLAQMEGLLGGEIPLPDLNEYLRGYTNRLPSESKSKFLIANSIWFRDNSDRLKVSPDFLQRNADYYGADAYKSVFDSKTVKDINGWVNSNTDGMIKEILDEIESKNMLFLINAIMFDAEWWNVYTKGNMVDGYFTDIGGTMVNAEYMRGAEYSYLDDGMATGFIKPYAGGVYSFAALLPNKDVPISEYIDSLSGAGFLDTLKNAQHVLVTTTMPKFKYEFMLNMNDVLIALGMPDAFSIEDADFSKMATSPEGNIYISKVLHKTFISVDELGTKAGAVTSVGSDSAGTSERPKNVRLDRPFVYAIIDNATNLPIFIGAVLTV